MISSSEANALGVNLEDTNINRGSDKQEGETEDSNRIMEIFMIAEGLVIYWDGKLLNF